ncbi:hypothetical protein [Neobacillus endophyticus]|uniref:hypothetical protein n=1 Tax=Neobacillus endophyticus TaxID=2738405 RepID=UPI001C25B376|nr:hypothetical protein [Neobacillus endophyticus]
MWAIGLLVDLAGMIALLLTVGSGQNSYTIWNDPITYLGFLVIVIVCRFLLGWANFSVSKKYVFERRVRWSIGLSMGILTAPWTFLIPTSMVFH